MAMTGRERIEAVLKGGVADVCPAAPVFWGAEYVWKVTGRTLLDQMHGRDPGYPHAALCLCARHNADWILLSVTDGDGWLEGKKVSRTDNGTCIHDPETNQDYRFDPSGHLVRRIGETARSVPAQSESNINTRSQVEDLFPESLCGHSEKERDCVSSVVEKVGGKTFVCACEIAPFVDVCYRFGAQTAMRKLIEDPDLFRYGTDISLEIQRARIRCLRDTGVHGVLIAESYASCDMISPAQYRRFALPHQKELVETVHECNMYALLLSTGNLMPILEDIAKVDADGLIIEESRKGTDMDVGKVRAVYGNGRCLFGNVSSERLLGPGEMRGVFDETLRQIQVAGGQGAFAISNGASPICDETHPVAIDIMIEAAHMYRY